MRQAFSLRMRAPPHPRALPEATVNEAVGLHARTRTEKIPRAEEASLVGRGPEIAPRIWKTVNANAKPPGYGYHLR